MPVSSWFGRTIFDAIVRVREEDGDCLIWRSSFAEAHEPPS
jgi:hypothetical protein